MFGLIITVSILQQMKISLLIIDIISISIIKTRCFDNCFVKSYWKSCIVDQMIETAVVFRELYLGDCVGVTNMYWVFTYSSVYAICTFNGFLRYTRYLLHYCSVLSKYSNHRPFLLNIYFYCSIVKC